MLLFFTTIFNLIQLYYVRFLYIYFSINEEGTVILRELEAEIKWYKIRQGKIHHLQKYDRLYIIRKQLQAMTKENELTC